MNRFATENLVFFDFESRCAVPIKWGAYRYAIEADPILLSYAIGNGPVKRVDRRGEALTWDDIPDDLKAEFHKGTIFCAFNTGFDRCIWNYSLDGAPLLRPVQVIDARAAALAHNLPDDLESLSMRLTGEGKQKDGKTLIATFCAPKVTVAGQIFYLKPNTPELLEQWNRFGTYADRDVEKLRTCFSMMQPALTAYDWAAYQANEVVNDTGAGVDLEFCRRAAALADEEAVRIGKRLGELTDGKITSINQNLRLAEWVHDRLPFAEAREMMSTVFKEEADSEDDADLVEKTKLSIGRGNVERLLDFLRAKECDDTTLMEVLELREFGASAAPKKFQAILDQNVGGRLYGQFTFNGAGQTGRFSGRGVQLQNLTRSTLGEGPSDDYGTWEEPTVALITDGCTLEELRAFGKGEVPARKLALTIRPAFIATGTRTLIKADYRQVEARVLPWLSNSKGGAKLLEDFHRSDIDPKFPDLYRRTAGPMTGQDPMAISSADRQRGKVAVLACLAADTRVLTDCGIKNIIDVNSTDKLWDGEEWVTHCGLVSRGQRPTINLDGVEVTPDHLVATNGTWMQAQQLASSASFLSQALATGSESLQSLAMNTAGPVVSSTAGHSAPAERRRIGFSSGISGWATRNAVSSALPSRTDIIAKTTTGTLISSLMTHTADVFWAALARASLVAAPRTTSSFLTMAGAASGFSLSGTCRSEAAARSARASGSFWHTLSRSMAGTTPNLRSTGSMSIRDTNPATCASQHGARTPPTNGRSRPCSGASSSLRPVYDIAHAGPRNRFTVLTDSGALLVHNCGFGGGRNALHSMAANYRLHFSDQEAQDIVDKWRAANPWAPAFWGRHTKDDSYGLFGAARRAIASPMLPVVCGRVQFVYISGRRDGMLICILPSGRPLIYPSCRMRDYDVVDKVTKKVLDTRHGLTFRRARGIIALYGGRFAENITQAAAADLLREAIVWLVAKGYKVVSHSHDEIVVECEKADVAQTTAAMEKAMLVADRKWADGLPLAVDITERWYYSASKKIGEAA